MRHTFYALFPGKARATAALRELEHFDVEVLVHERKLNAEKLDIAETDAMPRLVTGILVGTLLGPLVALGALAATGMPIGAPALILGALLGAGCCGLGGMLMGAGAPDQTLERLAAQATPGEVILTVVAPRYSTQEAAETVVRRHGGQIAERGVLTSNAPEPPPDPGTPAASQEELWENEGGNVPSVPTPRTDSDDRRN